MLALLAVSDLVVATHRQRAAAQPVSMPRNESFPHAVCYVTGGSEYCHIILLERRRASTTTAVEQTVLGHMEYKCVGYTYQTDEHRNEKSA
ncbi:hypothetical protein BDR03DRAFT_941054 [Suillus americanus]|nr:hypothetical protein BDR03DRAFT_941054 [Suillus americanus]